MASAGDDAIIMLWREKPSRSSFGDSGTSGGAISWGEDPCIQLIRGSLLCLSAVQLNDLLPNVAGPVCALRGHSSDVYDLAWAPTSASLFSGGVDGSTIVWNIEKAKPAQTLYDHHNYVQGVSWDPQDEFLVSVSCDRSARVYSRWPGQRAPRLAPPCQSRPPDPAYSAHLPACLPARSLTRHCMTAHTAKTQRAKGRPRRLPTGSRASLFARQCSTSGRTASCRLLPWQRRPV